ncbi:MAG: response regulator, partial [Myxococcales bacterium]|nr:response regulator [Myxococcales bacterium]
MLVRVLRSDRRGRSGAAWVRLEVEDTGIGIPEAEHGAVFEKFRQADASTTRLYGGTGLGLAITRELVVLMGGELGLRSTPGRGSTFWLELPLPRSEAPEPAPTEALAGVRALVVDDRAVARRVLRAQLERWGLECEACGSGPQALAAAEAARERGTPFEMVLLDQDMPGMDGLAVAEALQRRALGDPAVVLLTAVGARLDEDRLRALGLAGYLSKPARSSDLADVLLAAREARAAGRTSPLVSRARLRAQASRRVSRSFAGVRVLVAEDNPVNQRVALGLLERLGCRVDLAGNGHEAVGMAQTVPYDVVLMDVQMPEMDGLTAARAIRAHESAREHGAHLPIIAMTAHAMRGDRDRCIDAGMDGYVAKPVSLESLAEELVRFVPGSEPEGPPPPSSPAATVPAMVPPVGPAAAAPPPSATS